MERWARDWLKHVIRREGVLYRRRWRLHSAPAAAHCVRCGYELASLADLHCPECGKTNDAAWYKKRPAAGSKMRRGLVFADVVMSCFMAFQFGLLFYASCWECWAYWTTGVWSWSSVATVVAMGIGLVTTIAVAVFVVVRRRLLVWGPRRWVLSFYVFPVLAFAYYAGVIAAISALEP